MAEIPPCTRLTNVAIAAGLPVQCVNPLANGGFEIILRPGASSNQNAAAIALVNSYVDQPRSPQDLDAIIAMVQSLKPAQIHQILCVVAAMAIQANPGMALNLGIAISGDQIANN